MKAIGQLASFILHPLPEPRSKELPGAAWGIEELGLSGWGGRPGFRVCTLFGKDGILGGMLKCKILGVRPAPQSQECSHTSTESRG